MNSNKLISAFTAVVFSLLMTLSAGAQAAPVERSDAPAMATVSMTEKIDVNTAGAKQLSKLAGVGKSKAAAIIAWRTENGDFKTTDDLLKVPGVGAATILRNQALIDLPAGKVNLMSKLSAKQKARYLQGSENDQAAVAGIESEGQI